MNILQVSCNDVVGSRFNGRDLNKRFRQLGFDAQQCVWHREGDDQFTWELAGFLPRMLKRRLNHVVSLAEAVLSVQSMLYPWPLQLLHDKRFTNADIVHYHLLHNGYFSLQALPKITSLKPSVLTIHDPWLLCGHCIYPLNCERWKTGCGACPALGNAMPMARDNTRYMFESKRNVFAKCDLDVVVASEFMLEMVQNSPIFKDHRIHYIPFGVDTSVFRSLIPSEKGELRARYGIGSDRLVISFREIASPYKGLPYIKESLRRLSAQANGAPLTLLTVDQKGLLSEFEDTFQVLELGLVTDENTMSDFYNCSDIFLMPSTAEAFGVMAIEAMACGVPVIVFDGTSLPGVIFSPAGGLSVETEDADALYRAIDELLKDPRKRKSIGDEAYRLSRIHYDFDDHADKVLQLYEDVLSRRRKHN